MKMKIGSKNKIREVILSPSTLNYEDRRCDRCFGLQLAGERWPRTPFPGLFSQLDSQQRKYFNGSHTHALDAQLPHGTIHNGGRVKSAPYTIDGINFVIRGSMDCLIHFDDGSVGAIDYKSSSAKDLDKAYRPQLASYGWALSNPADGEPKKVSVHGIAAFAPTEMCDTDKGRAYIVSTTWYPYEIGDEWIKGMFRRLVPLIKDPYEMPSREDCGWCELRQMMKRSWRQ